MSDANAERADPLTIDISSLRLGWLVDRDIWADGQRLVVAGVEITDSLIQSLRRRGITQVQIASDSEAAHLFCPVPADDRFHTLLASNQEILATHNVQMAVPSSMVEEASAQIEDYFKALEKGQELDVNEARPMIRKLVQTFLERSQYAVKLLDLEKVDQYTYRHSINVGLLYMMVAVDWYDNENDLIEVVFGAVLHDLGKSKVGSEIINYPGKLNEEQWAKMKMHPIWGAELLVNAGAHYTAVQLALSHHERMDGTGYPHKLATDQISRDVRLLNICDVYDALTTKRSYKSKLDFAHAIDIIVQGCGTQFDASMVHHFVNRVGRYPVGTYVELSSGEFAVVVRVNPGALSRPVVSRVMSAEGVPLNVAEELDLREQDELYITDIVISAEGTA